MDDKQKKPGVSKEGFGVKKDNIKKEWNNKPGQPQKGPQQGQGFNPQGGQGGKK